MGLTLRRMLRRFLTGRIGDKWSGGLRSYVSADSRFASRCARHGYAILAIVVQGKITPASTAGPSPRQPDTFYQILRELHFELPLLLSL
jgi:hypothetical protein